MEEEEHPLFMDKLPDNPQENPILASLQDLLYEGPPEEVADGFKSLGNTQMALKSKKGYAEATKFYSQGLELKSISETLRISLLNNRAQAQLELKNYGNTLKDCKEVIALQPTDMKANWRAGRATYALGRFEEAKEYLRTAKCHGGDPKFIDELAAKCEEEIAKAARRPPPSTPISETLASRGIKTRKVEVELPYPYEVSLGEDDFLRLSVLFLYHQPMQSDFIQAMREDETFSLRLSEVLPPPWDEGGLYTMESTRIFYQKKGGYSEVLMRASLGDTLRNRDYFMPQFPVFHLVSTKTDVITQFVS